MISGIARNLKIGDRVVAIKDGFSDGIFYRRGDRGEICEKVEDNFRVRLDSGKETAFVPIEKWEIDYQSRSPVEVDASNYWDIVFGK